MKKMMLAIALCGMFAACNSNATPETTDSIRTDSVNSTITDSIVDSLASDTLIIL